MTDFPASTRWLQTPNGAIAVKADGSVWRVQGSQHDRLCSENEWLARVDNDDDLIQNEATPVAGAI